jgi:hypothetical protein
MSFYICFGKYAGFHFECNKRVPFRVVLGFVSVALVSCDIEVMVDKLLNKLEE